jgi:hypothetical protein
MLSPESLTFFAWSSIASGGRPKFLTAPRLLTQWLTLIRDLHCIRGGGGYFAHTKARLDGSPSPDTPPSGQISLK